MTRRTLFALPFLAPVARALGMKPESWMENAIRTGGVVRVPPLPDDLNYFRCPLRIDSSQPLTRAMGEEMFRRMKEDREARRETWEYFIAPGAFDLKRPGDPE